MYFSIQNNRSKNKHIKKLTELVETAGGSITVHDYNTFSTVEIRGNISGYVGHKVCSEQYYLKVYDRNHHETEYNVPITSIDCIYGC